MKKKLIRRIAAIASAAVISVGAACLFSGCTSKHPEITIVYEFNDVKYEVDYKLSRLDAPQTVQHFIELADAGYYDNTIIHDFDGTYMRGGGYTLSAEGGDRELEEKDYFAEVQALAEKGHKFTQSVWVDSARTIPLYTVYGEFEDNGSVSETNEFSLRRGALVMDYTEKKDATFNVTIKRNDKGKNNNGKEYQELPYALNSATSLFYTYLTSSGMVPKDRAVFGMAMDFSGQLQPLLDAITAFEDELDDEVSFTELQEDVPLNKLDYFGTVQTGGETADFNTPMDWPITIKTIKVNKY